jgi:hypothetical protein
MGSRAISTSDLCEVELIDFVSVSNEVRFNFLSLIKEEKQIK